MAVIRRTEEPEAPDAVLVNRRWIPIDLVEWAKDANEILLEHGMVSGTAGYQARSQAKWRAQKLIGLLVELGLHDRWDLREHTDPVRGKWKWTVEYLGGRNA